MEKASFWKYGKRRVLQ